MKKNKENKISNNPFKIKDKAIKKLDKSFKEHHNKADKIARAFIRGEL